MTRSTKAKLVQFTLLGLVGVLVALLWRPAQVQYYLYQFRRDEAAARPAIQAACDLGEDTRGPLIDAVHAYAHESGAGYFRPAAFQTLVCLRESARAEDPAPFPRPDDEAIDAMRTLIEEEPSASYRSAMQRTSYDLDEWSRLLLWERVTPDIHLEPPLHFTPRSCGPNNIPCGLHSTQVSSPAEWCALVGPVLTRWLADGVAGVSDFAVLRRLSEHRCLDGEVAAAALQARQAELSESEVDEVLFNAYADADAQSALIGELIRSSAACERHRYLLDGLEVRRPHTEATKEVLRAWAHDIDASCLAETFPEAPVDERRPRMSRALGITE